MVRAGLIKPTEVVVVNLTGHTLPVEKMILGDGWIKNMVLTSKQWEEKPEEGLLSALSRVTPDRYSRIVIVDDHADSRRLIRRILQSQGEYTIHEVDNGRDAINLAKSEYPDVMILDLMMPEIDGFSVIDALKADERTASISIIVTFDAV